MQDWCRVMVERSAARAIEAIQGCVMGSLQTETTTRWAQWSRKKLLPLAVGEGGGVFEKLIAVGSASSVQRGDRYAQQVQHAVR